MSQDQEANALFARLPFTLDEVSPEIHDVARKNFSIFLRNINQLGLAYVGDKLQLHVSNVSRMKDSGELLKVVATNLAVGIDVAAMEEEINRLREENAAYRVLLKAKFNDQKEKPEVSCN